LSKALPYRLHAPDNVIPTCCCHETPCSSARCSIVDHRIAGARDRRPSDQELSHAGSSEGHDYLPEPPPHNGPTYAARCSRLTARRTPSPIDLLAPTHRKDGLRAFFAGRTIEVDAKINTLKPAKGKLR
jgi:hypothetical protein